MNHGNAVHNHFHQQNMPPGTSYPYSATPNHGNHHPPTLFSLASPSQQQPGNHHHPPQTNPIHMPNHIPAIDHTLIAVYLQHLNLSAATAASAQQQRPHVSSHTTSSMHAAPAVVSTASSVASQQQKGRLLDMMVGQLVSSRGVRRIMMLHLQESRWCRD